MVHMGLVGGERYGCWVGVGLIMMGLVVERFYHIGVGLAMTWQVGLCVQQCSGGIGIPVVINGLRDGAG